MFPPQPTPETFAGLQLLGSEPHWIVLVQSAISFAAAIIGIGLVAGLAYRTRGGFRQDFLSVAELAPKRLFEELPDPVIVINDDRVITIRTTENRAGWSSCVT